MGLSDAPLVLRLDASLPSLVRARLAAHADGDAVRVEDAARPALVAGTDARGTTPVTVRTWDGVPHAGAGPTVWLVPAPVALATLPVGGDAHAAWLPLDAEPSQLLAAARAVRDGLVVLAPAALRERRGASRAPVRTPSERVSGDAVEGAPLTERELDVLRALAEGLGNKQVAARLGIGTSTVKSHLAAIYAKLGAHTRSEAVSRGLRAGLVPL